MSHETFHNPFDRRHVALVLVAKWPIPGHVKTRLANGLSASKAAAIYEVFLQHTRNICENLARASGSLELVLLFDPPETPEVWNHWRQWRRIPQSRGNLGARLESGLDMLAEESINGCVFIGADAPELTADHIAWATDEVVQSHFAMIPAHDGGYVLIGIPAGDISLFQGISWSTPQVAAQTRRNAARREVVIAELPPLHDVDILEDFTALLDRLANTPGDAAGPFALATHTNNVSESVLKVCESRNNFQDRRAVRMVIIEHWQLEAQRIPIATV